MHPENLIRGYSRNIDTKKLGIKAEKRRKEKRRKDSM